MRKTRSQQLAKLAQSQRAVLQKNLVVNSNVEMGPPPGPPHAQHPICYSNDPILGHPSPRPRNAIANAPEMRYRLIGSSGSGPPGPGLQEKGRPSFDYSKKKMSLAPVESDTDGAAGEGVGGGGGTPGTPPPSIPIPGAKNQNTLFGVCPSDIDKYSRVVFPVCFLCFNLMYWIIYM